MKKLINNLLFDRWVLLFTVLVFFDMLIKHNLETHGVFFGYFVEVFLLILFNLKRCAPKLIVIKTQCYLLFFSALICFTMMFIFHLLAKEVITDQIVYRYIDLVFLLYFTFFSKINKLEEIGFAIKIVTIIGSLSVLFVSQGDVLYDWRKDTDTLADKGYLTILFAISQCLCIADIIYKRNIAMNIILLMFFLYINMFFVQSKTAFLSLAFNFIVMFALLRGRFRFYFIIGLLAFAIIIFFNSSFLLTDSIANGINVFFGSEIFGLDAQTEKYSMVTFDMRDMITNYSLLLFLKSPLWGIGIGGYEASGGILGVMECESTFLDMLVEGGLLYFMPILASIIIPLVVGFYNAKIKKETSYQLFWVLSVIPCIIVCFYYNDFLFPFPFALIGICSYVVFNKNERYKTVPTIKY